MDLTKFLDLWPIEPNLQPDGLEHNPDWHWTLGGTDIGADHAAALIRDKAVLVGGQKWGFGLKWFPQHNDWSVLAVWDDGECPSHDDPTEALYLAVCKVLGREP